MSTRNTDFSHQTVWSLLGLLELHEFFITVDHFAIWRRHLAWAKQDGSELKALMTQRFSSSMVFMSLLLGAELGLLFNSSKITTDMRLAMIHQDYADIKFWIGFMVLISVFLTLFTLIATFTAWGMVSVVSDSNAHCMLRSSIGQYVTQLPSRLTVSSVYSFLLWVSMWVFALLPGIWSKILLLVMGGLFLHVVAVYSAFGRLVILSGAMGCERVFDQDFEQALLPSGLHASLLIKAIDRQKRRTTVTAQYRKQNGDHGRILKDVEDHPGTTEMKMSIPSEKRSNGRGRATPPPRHRRVNTIESILSDESYIIRKNARALFGDGGAASPPRAELQSVTENETQAPTSHIIFPSGAALVSPMATETDLGRECNSSIESVDDELESQEDEQKDNIADAHSSPSFVLRHDRQHATTDSVNEPIGRAPSSRQLQRMLPRRRFGELRKKVSFKGEWEDDQEARSLYNRPPAANVHILHEDKKADEGPLNHERRSGWEHETILPRPSLLNQASHSRKSIARLTGSLKSEEENSKEIWSNLQILSLASEGLKPITKFVCSMADRNLDELEYQLKGDPDSVVLSNEGDSLERGENAGTNGWQYGGGTNVTETEWGRLLDDSTLHHTSYSTGEARSETVKDSNDELRNRLSTIESIGDLEEELRKKSTSESSPPSSTCTSSKDGLVTNQ